jgi:hypothetical protein
MKTEDLPLPKSVLYAKFIDGVREMLTYDIATDTFLVRWDLVVDNKQYFVMKHQPIGYVAKNTENDSNSCHFANSERQHSIKLLHILAENEVPVYSCGSKQSIKNNT